MIKEWLSALCETGRYYLENADFIFGLSLGGCVVLLLVLAVWYWRFRASRCNTFILEEENGYFQLTAGAIRSFLGRVVAEFPALTLQKSRLRQHDAQMTIDLYLLAGSTADLTTCRSGLRQRIIDEARDKLGLSDKIESVNLIVTELQPQEAAEKPNIPDAATTTPAN